MNDYQFSSRANVVCKNRVWKVSDRWRDDVDNNNYYIINRIGLFWKRKKTVEESELTLYVNLNNIK